VSTTYYFLGVVVSAVSQVGWEIQTIRSAKATSNYKRLHADPLSARPFISFLTTFGSNS
jgi:hypothetical protein